MKSEEFFCFSSLRFEDERKIDKNKVANSNESKKGQSVGSSQPDCPFSFKPCASINYTLLIVHIINYSQSYQSCQEIRSRHLVMLRSKDIHHASKFRRKGNPPLPYHYHLALPVPSCHSSQLLPA